MSADDAQRYREARGIGKPHPEHPHRIDKMQDGQFLATCKYCGKRCKHFAESSGAALAWLGEHVKTKEHLNRVGGWGAETDEDRLLQSLLEKGEL